MRMIGGGKRDSCHKKTHKKRNTQCVYLSLHSSSSITASLRYITLGWCYTLQSSQRLAKTHPRSRGLAETERLLHRPA